MEAHKSYKALDPRTLKDQSAVNLVFVNQSATDICQKLQRLKGFEGKKLAELIAIS